MTVTLKEYKNGKIAVNTRTQEEYHNLMRFFEKKGILSGMNTGMMGTNLFYIHKAYTYVRIENNKFTIFTEKNDKIILPTDLKEYNEYMGKQNIWYDESAPISKKAYNKLLKIAEEETQYLSIGQAIDYMLESEENVIEYYDTRELKEYRIKIIEGEFYRLHFVSWVVLDPYLNGWTKIKKHIEPKQKTLQEKLEAKEPFNYKDEWYRFNKDGAIIDSKGSAIGIDIINKQ